MFEWVLFAASFLYRGHEIVGCLTELHMVQVGVADLQREIVCPTFLQNEHTEGNHGHETEMRWVTPLSKLALTNSGRGFLGSIIV